jgi:hypothetical protein
VQKPTGPRVEVEAVLDATSSADIARAVDLLLVAAAARDGAAAPHVVRPLVGVISGGG